MANPQPNQFTKISNELFEAIMQTDFTKRQRNILDLILRLSYGCRKKHAILRPSDFEMVGVGRNHIQQEIKMLIKCNVLFVQGEIYQLNKDYDTWRVTIHRYFETEKFEKILHRNLSGIVPELGTDGDEQTIPETGIGVPETGTIFDNDDGEKFPKQEHHSSQNRNTAVPKTGIGTLNEPSGDAGSRVPKESIKESIKESSGTKIQSTEQGTEDSSLISDFSFSRIYQVYEKHFAENGRITPIEVEDLSDQFDTYGGEWVLEAMREAVRNGKRTLAYINGVLKGFKQRGGTLPEERGSPGSAPDETRKFLDEQERLLQAKRAQMQQRDGQKEVKQVAGNAP